MPIHDTDFTRRLRSVASPTPSRTPSKLSPFPPRDFDRDVFVDVETTQRAMSPKLKGKGKAVERDYGDRYVDTFPPCFLTDRSFIPTRENQDIHTTYSLLSEEGGYLNGKTKPRTRGKNVSSLSSDAEARRGACLAHPWPMQAR